MIPDLSFLWVIFFLLTTVFLLNTLVFTPILRMIAARLQAVSDARQLAESASQRASSARAEYDTKLNAARGEVYSEMDEKRRVALDRRTALVGETRELVQRELKEAAGRVQQQSEAARAALAREAHTLAETIEARVMGAS